jgi:crossover junction endodeoxyribonuclease RusA
MAVLAGFYMEAQAALTFSAYGIPIPKGSMRTFIPKGWKRAIITNDNARTKPWQDCIVTAAREELAGRPPMEGPVAVAVRFFLPRPKSAPRRVTEHLKKPDLDKLLRCVKDGLTRAGVYHDDAQVVLTVARKDFAGGVADPEGVRGVPRAVLVVAGPGVDIVKALDAVGTALPAGAER